MINSVNQGGHEFYQMDYHFSLKTFNNSHLIYEFHFSIFFGQLLDKS